MSSTPQRKLAVILHADVVGSTALVQQDETLSHQRLMDAFDRFSSTIEAYRGVVHEIRGDALVAEFARASDAVCAAIAFQQTNATHNANLDDPLTPIIRVGLGMGEVVIADGTITGAGVVLAQRLEQLADPGGVCIQGAAYETVPQRLPIDFKHLGERQLKGFTEPVRIYAATLRSGAVVPTPDPLSLGLRFRRSKWLRLTAGIVAVLILVGGPTIWWGKARFNSTRLETGQTSPLARPAIAVLPFENLSRDPEQDYFSDGITNDIINDLSRFSNLTVIARNSVFTFKGKPTKIQTIGRELGASYVLEGSVQRVGNRVRINAQFVDARSGTQLWADGFDEVAANWLDLQDQITERIVRTLSIRVTELERRRVFSRSSVDLTAYDLMLRGQALLAQLTRAENFRAREYFQQAIEIEPAYACAYAGLGWTYMNAILYGWMGSPRLGLTRAEELARKAIALDETCVDAHRLLAEVHQSKGEHDLALLELERAIAINPNDSNSHAKQGLALVYSNRVDAAIRSLETALRFDPNMSPEALMHLGMAYYLKRRYSDALPLLQRGAARNPDNVFIQLILAATYAQLDRREDASRAAATVLRLDPFFRTETYGGRKYVDSEAVSHIVEGLRKAGLE